MQRPHLGVELALHRLVVGRDRGHGAEGLLHLHHQVPGGGRGPGGQLVGGAQQLVVLHAAPHQPGPLGLGPVEDLAEEEGGGGRLGPGDAVEHPGVAAAGVEAQLQEAGVEAGPTGGQAHVAGQGQVHARAHRGAVHRGDGGQRAARHAQEPLVDRQQALALRGAQVRQVGAGAEGPALAGDDDGAHALVGLHGLDRGDEVVAEGAAQGVAPVGVVEGEEGDAVGDVGADEAHGVVVILLRRGRRRGSGGRTARRPPRSGTRSPGCRSSCGGARPPRRRPWPRPSCTSTRSRRP